MEGSFFSVVVIACNVAPYLPKCLDSILRQNYTDFEVLLSIEESSDSTKEIAEQYARRDNRIKVRCTPASGSASRIRNWGMENCAGKYIIFVDGDDWIQPDALAKFKSKIDEFGELDIIPATATVYRENPDGGIVRGERIFCGKIPDRIFTGGDYLKEVCPINKLRTATWMAAFRTDFLRDDPTLRQPDGRRHQDDEWTPRVFCAAKRVAGLDFAFYNYRIRGGSITTKLNPKSLEDVAKNIVSFLNFWESGKIPPEIRNSFATWYADYSNRFFTAHSRQSFDRALRRKCFLVAVGNRKNFLTFKKMTKFASASKRLLNPIFTIARFGACGFALAENMYRFIYEPIVFRIWPLLSKRMPK